MNKEKELVKNAGIIAIGKISSQIATFLLLPLYISILSASEFGIVDLILSYIQLLLPIVNLQLDQSLFRFLVNKRNDINECSTVISTIVFFSFVQVLIYVILFLILQLFISSSLKWFFLLNTICLIYSSLMANCARGLGKNLNYSVQSFVAVLFNILFNITFLVFLKFGVSGMLLASALSSLFAGTYGLVFVKPYLFFSLSSVNTKKIKEFYSFSIPLIPNQLSWWVMNASDKTVINLFVSLTANGIIAVASKFSSAYILVFNLFNLAWTESVVLHINDNDGKIYLEKIINKVFLLFSAVCFGIISFMPFVFRLFVPNVEYAEVYNLIPIFLVSSLCNVVVGLYSAIYVANKDTKAVASTSGIAAGINLLVDLSLVRLIGIYAAPISTFTGFAVAMVYRYFHSRKYIDVRIENRILFFTILIGFIIVFLYYINNTMTNLLSVFLCVSYAITILFRYFQNFAIIK